MTKQNGLGDNFYLGGYNISGDTSAFDEITATTELQENTGIDKSAYERLGGLRDGKIAWTAWFNDAAERAHVALSPLPTADTQAMYFRGTTLGGSGAAAVVKQVNYGGKRSDKGELSFEVEALGSSYGIEWGALGTAGIRTDTTATNGSAIDNGAATSYGLQAYLQVFAVTGTSVTVKLQESSDSGGSDAWADVTGGAFGAKTGRAVQRIATANNLPVERYLRVVTSGTFSNAQFAVLIVRNEVEGVVF